MARSEIKKPAETGFELIHPEHALDFFGVIRFGECQHQENTGFLGIQRIGCHEVQFIVICFAIAGHDTLTNVNQVMGSSFNDTLLGSNNAAPSTELFFGGSGDDFIES